MGKQNQNQNQRGFTLSQIIEDNDEDKIAIHRMSIDLNF